VQFLQIYVQIMQAIFLHYVLHVCYRMKKNAGYSQKTKQQHLLVNFSTTSQNNTNLKFVGFKTVKVKAE